MEFGSAYTYRPYQEAVFHSYLAHALQKSGYPISRNARDFELSGFEKSTLDKYSNRTKAINEKADELGIKSAKAKDKLGATTRSKKKDYDRKDLIKTWDSELTAEERHHIANIKNDHSDDQKITANQALDYALAHTLSRKSVATKKELMMHGLKRGYGQVIPEQLDKVIAKRKDLLSRQDKSGEVLYTTKEVLQEEKQLIKSSKDGLGKHEAINSGYEIQKLKLTAEQQVAVQHVLSSKDFITAINGKAGVGKTYSVKEVAQGVEQAGLSFTAVAPSSQASRGVQRSEGFEGATTVADLLQNKKYHNQIKGGMIWVDEPTLMGNASMNKLIGLAKDHDARLLLTGDLAQHTSVERGDAYRVLQKFGGIEPARIDKIQRQKQDDYRKAVTAISEGEIVKGFNTLDKMGAIKESENLDAMYQNASDEFVSALKNKDNVMVVSTTHKQGQTFTESAREKMRNEGLLSGKERVFDIQKNLNFTDAEKTDRTNYQQGQIIQFHQHVKGGIKRGSKYVISDIGEQGNVFIKPLSSQDETKSMRLPMQHADRFSVYDKEEVSMAKGDILRVTQNGFSADGKRLNNGNVLKVKGFDKEGNILATTPRREVTISKDYGNMNLGYYQTSQSSQGATVNKVMILQSTMSGQASNRQQLYVSASRGKFSISVHTDNKDFVLTSAQRSSERMAAMELMDNKAQKDHSRKEKLDKIIQAGKDRLKRTQFFDKTKQTEKNIDHGKSAPTK